MSIPYRLAEPGDSAPDTLVELTWRTVGVTVLFVSALILFVYSDSAMSIVEIWSISDTFEHGFLVIPLFLYLCWLKKDELAAIPPARSTVALLALFISGFLWFASLVFGVMVIQHIAFVMVIVCTIWALIGSNAAKVISFPLAFLFFAAPVGDELVPLMMEFTADIVVLAIRASGIPIYREGLYFSLPSGDWSVVEACSGIRYLIASLVLGSVFAYLNLVKFWTRFWFMVFAVGVPIIANGLRAYMIVMIAHHSSNTLAVGIDHFIYGWLFFGIVMTMLFVFGYWLRSLEKTDDKQSTANFNVDKGLSSTSKVHYTGQVAVVLFLIALWPVYSYSVGVSGHAVAIDSSTEKPQESSLAFSEVSPWQLSTTRNITWRPLYSGFDKEILAHVSGDDSTQLMVNVLTYTQQFQGKEMINGSNILLPQKHTIWRMLESGVDTIHTEAGEFKANRTVLSSKSQEIVVWWWFRVGDFQSGNRYVTKLVEGVNTLFSRQVPSQAIFIAVDSASNDAKNALSAFLNMHGRKLR